jgi:DNA ligase-1
MKKVTFGRVCGIFDTLEGTASRNDMTDILVTFYKELTSDDAQILSYLIQGRVAPLFVNSEFNYSEKSFLNLLNNIFQAEDIKEELSEKRGELGDIGSTLEYFSAKLNYKSKNLSLLEMYEILWKVINSKGTGSIESKNAIVMDTLRQMSPLEAKYFGRIVCGSLRSGLNVKTLLDVFSFVIQGDKGVREELDRAYGAYVDIGYICSLVVGGRKKDILRKLANVTIEPGIPVLPRLVERVSSFEEVSERLGESFLLQNKYDGLRCQIHKYSKEKRKGKNTIWFKYLQKEENGSLFSKDEDDYEVRLFTRNLEDVTEMFPEIVEDAKDMENDSFILDSEALGWDSSKEKFMTFQETMQRRRKYDIKNMKESVPVRAMVFDILYLDGENLSQEDTSKRIEILGTLNTQGSIQTEKTKEVKSLEELNESFDNAVKLGHEGVIVKKKQGSYLPGVRNYEWIKLKKSMQSKLVDSIDLVAVGYTLGSGRRSTLGVGSVLGALYNKDNDSFEAICNVGTGFTDEQLREIFKTLEVDIVKKNPKNVNVEKMLEPDVWVQPRVVFTVEADEITKKKGSNMLSLRFPRLVEWGRDKGVTEATSVEELEGMYKGSKKVEKS